MAANEMKREISSVEGLLSENPVFPSECGPEMMMSKISRYAAEIKSFNSSICSIIEDEGEWSKEEVASAKFSREAVTAVASIETACRRLQSRPVGQPPKSATAAALPTPVASVTGNSESATELESETDDQVRPPGAVQLSCAHGTSSHTNRLTREYDMTPRKFSGNRLQFRTFMAEFEEYVGRREDVSSLRKLIILRKFLEGEPLIIVEALELTDSNYKVARSLLEKNFSRVDSEKTKVISELRTLPSVSRPYDYAAISRLVTTVQSHISVLAVNGVTLPEFSLTLLDSMEASLPPRLRQDFLDHQQADKKYQRRALADNSSTAGAAPGSSQQQPTLTASETAAKEVEALISSLRQRLRDMERLKQESSASSSDKKTSETQSKVLKENKKFPRSTIAAVSRRSETGTSAGKDPAKRSFRTKQCLFCRNSEHSSSRCSANLTVRQRLETLRKLDRCEKCFRPKHSNPQDCEGPRSPCSRCESRQHYSSMHVDETPAAEAVVSAMVNKSNNICDALLWTACAYVVNGGKRIPIKIFVNPGTSLTIATPALRREIPESPIGQLNLDVQAFVSTHSKKNVPVRSLRLVGPQGGSEIVIQACEHEIAVDPPNIAPTRIVDAIKKFDRRFPVADRSYLGEWKSKAPAVLLGMDQSRKFMIDSRPPIDTDELRGYQTQFGWGVGGPIGNQPLDPVATGKPARLVCCAATSSHKSTSKASTTEAMQNLWRLEAIGIADSTMLPSMSADEESAVLQFQTSVIYASVPQQGSRGTLGFPSTVFGVPAEDNRRKPGAPTSNIRWKREVPANNFCSSDAGLKPQISRSKTEV